MILNPWDVQSKHIHTTDGICSTLYAGECSWGGGTTYVLVEVKMTYQDKTGPLMASGYDKLGTQEAMNDMYVTDGGGQMYQFWDGTETATALTTRNAGGGQRMPDKQQFNAVVENTQYIARRLTPTECARLQGFPDDWCSDVPHSDSAEYKLWGNGIALPCLLPMMKAMKEKLQEEM